MGAMCAIEWWEQTEPDLRRHCYSLVRNSGLRCCMVAQWVKVNLLNPW